MVSIKIINKEDYCAEVRRRMSSGNPKLSPAEVSSLAELAYFHQQALYDLPINGHLDSMSHSDLLAILTGCPESEHFMNASLNLPKFEALCQVKVLIKSGPPRDEPKNGNNELNTSE